MQNSTNKKPAKKFRPQDLPKSMFLHDRLKYGMMRYNYTWINRLPRGSQVPWLENWARHIHYLTSHAPKAIKKRWRQAEARWDKRTQWWKANINNRV